MAEFKGLSQFCAPLNFELGGRSFHLIMDGGEEILLNFMDGENVQIAKKGETFIWESYKALKADATTYFVHIQPAKSQDLQHFVAILDTAQSLVTTVTVDEAFDPEHPRLMRVVPGFGAIKVPGMGLPEIRHHLSDRMAGEHIVWHYNPDFSIQHIYHTPFCVRASAPPNMTREEQMKNRFEEQLASEDPVVREKAEEDRKNFLERQKWYPFYEEPCFHIWINDHMNLFSFVEENMTMSSPGFTEGGGGMIVLQDTERLIDMGLCFNPANIRYSDTYLLTAYGKENLAGDPLDVRESPYDWSKFKCMPCHKWGIPKE